MRTERSDQIETIMKPVELRAADAGIRTYYKFQANTDSEAFRSASNDYDFAQRILDMNDEDPEFLRLLAVTGLTAPQYRQAMRQKALEAQQRMEALSAPTYLPTMDFLYFVAHERFSESQRAETLVRRVTELEEKSKKLACALVLIVVIALCAIVAPLLSTPSGTDPQPNPPQASGYIPPQTTYPNDDTATDAYDFPFAPPEDPDAGLTALPYPETGMPLYSYCNPEDRVAPLTVKTSGEEAYYVKLVSKSNPTFYLTFFIRPGETAEYHAPLGDFELRYASGYDWYGTEDLFGYYTSYTRANDLFTFYADEDGYMGYTITLYPVENGNMHTEEIDPAEF